MVDLPRPHLPRPALSRRRLATLPAAAAVAVAGTMTAPPSPASAAVAAARPIDYHQWTGSALERGEARGLAVAKDLLHIPDGARGTRERRLGGTTYETGTWVSPWRRPGFALTQLVPSWSARTPGDSFVEVRVRGRDADGRRGSWDLVARWAADDEHLERTSFGSQGDDLGSVDVDTWTTRSGAGVEAYQLRITLARRVGQDRTPRVSTIGAMASRLPSGAPATSRPGRVRGVTLDVPRFSQMIHRGHYPQWGNGGEAWCSPTATSMVLGYYDALPGRRATAWIPAGHPDPVVDHAARRTFDHAYQGTGNWPFNTAYAATRMPRGSTSFVTRLRDARQAEKFIAAGIPLITSISFGAGELSGAPISASNGHLLVVVGFDRDGDVVVNDPAASSASGVRRTYDRAQFERAWLTRSGGLTYVIADRKHPLPGGRQSNW